MRNYPILTTKLNRHRYFQTYFKRERLENIFEKNRDRIATLLIAVAGYGKNTLVSQWIKNKQTVLIRRDSKMNRPTVIGKIIMIGSVLTLHK